MKKPKSQPIFDTKDFPICVTRMGFMEGLGVDMEELKQKPIIAIANSQTDINPGHMHLKTIAERVKEGVHAGGGIPMEFNVPAPCDVLTEGNDGMRFILAQRDLIADIIETHCRSMLYDALVMIASCDKIIPGMIMAAARLNLPTIFITGGPSAFQIRFNPQRTNSISNVDYDDPTRKAETITVATCGSCEVIGTANTMQCLVEAMGLTIPGSSNVPAFHSKKLLHARNAGKRIVAMVEEELTIRKIVDMKALENALMVDLAIGGSTNSALHLPAIAHNLELEFPLSKFNEFNTKIPTLCKLMPNGPHGMVDFYMAGGVPAVIKVLADDIHTGAKTAIGMTWANLMPLLTVKDPDVIPEKKNAFRTEGGTVVLYGNLAPEGAVIKQSAVAEDMLTFTGRAHVFESEHDALAALRERNVHEGEVLVIRNEGPKGGPGMPETLAVTMGLSSTGIKRVGIITDGRFSGGTEGPCLGHVSPEAYEGGPIALVREGDNITIDIPARKIELHVSDDELTQRKADWIPLKRELPQGFIRRYVKYVGSASKGAILS
ncbi:MAG TPA: dihydroxy-acid dehydratase [Smithellaceae bacterium]|nr:dihydroxy-acid dehydratase [Smithellaceae bacterium]HQM44551.1 dihydroxy-acid dehydratase [Smithellaceae bacterium]